MQSSPNMKKDAFPLWIEGQLYKLPYIWIDHRSPGLISVSNSDQSIIYFLPYGTMIKGTRKIRVTPMHRNAETVHLIHYNSVHCNITLEVHRGYHVHIITSCPWFVPVVVIDMNQNKTMAFQNDGTTHYLYPQAPLEIHLQKSMCFSSTIILIEAEQKDMFSYLKIQDITCKNASLHIYARHKRSLVISHIFHLDHAIDDWLSDSHELIFVVEFKGRTCNCSIKLHHEFGRYTWCLHNWFEVPGICDAWSYHPKTGGCVKYSCYILFALWDTSWINAEAACQDHGGHLVTINSHEELRLITLILLKWMPGISEYLYIGMVSNSSQVCLSSLF